MSMRPPMVGDTQGNEMYCVKCIGRPIVVSNLAFYIGHPSDPPSPFHPPPLLPSYQSNIVAIIVIKCEIHSENIQ